MTRKKQRQSAPLAVPVADAMRRREQSIATAEPPAETVADVRKEKTHRGICNICGHEFATTHPVTTECPKCGCDSVYFHIAAS